MTLRLTLRMIAPTAAISLLLLAVGVGTAWHVHTMQRTISHTLLLNVSSMRAAEELELAVREARTQVHHHLLTGNRSHLDRIHLLRPEIDRWLAEAVRWATTEQEQVLMRRVSAGLREFFAQLDRAGQSAPRSRPNPLEHLAEELLTRQVLDPTHEYLDYNEKELEKTSRQNRIQAGRLVFGLLLLGTCGSAAGLVAGLGLARAINRSLVQLSVPLRAAAGQLDEAFGPITFAASWDLNAMEGVLQVIANRIGTMIERLRQSEREVLRAEQLATVGQMAAGMAHELRNPLMAMKILVQAALVRHDAGGGHLGGRDLAVLEEEITRLERVIQTFLHFARPPRPEMRAVAIQPLLESSVDLVAARAGLCDVRIDLDLPETVLEAVVDPGQLRQILLNLLLNAIDALPGGGTIRMAMAEEEPGWLSLQVRDDGPGLPADLGERIFAPFVSTKETGLGLGLSISRRIAEGHGGSIEARDHPEGGAEFTLRLPLEGRTDSTEDLQDAELARGR